MLDYHANGNNTLQFRDCFSCNKSCRSIEINKTKSLLLSLASNMLSSLFPQFIMDMNLDEVRLVTDLCKTSNIALLQKSQGGGSPEIAYPC